MNAEEEARKDKSIYIVVHTPVIPGMSVELRTYQHQRTSVAFCRDTEGLTQISALSFKAMPRKGRVARRSQNMFLSFDSPKVPPSH